VNVEQGAYAQNSILAAMAAARSCAHQRCHIGGESSVTYRGDFMSNLKSLFATAWLVLIGCLVAGVAVASGEDIRSAKQLRHEARLAGTVEQSGSNPEIIGGVKAPAGAWPFQVALLYRPWGGSNYNMEWCGGSLVDSLHVITAAHCVFGYTANQFWVLTNTQSLAGSQGTRHRIASIKIHPDYDDLTVNNDIAVITLQTPATGIAFYATLISPAEEPVLANAGTLAYVIGWGSTIATGGGYPTDLMQVRVPLVTSAECNDRDSYRGDITTRMICAGYPQGAKDSCDGDSGGPLIVKDATGRWRLQAGVVSWGDGCARPERYGVYSRVAVLSAWAERTIARSVSSPATVPESTRCSDLRGASQSACLDGLSLAPK
jgi:secreted trypsin-like serine protease